MIDALFSDPVTLMEKSMNLRMVRQGYLASNIANAETPNYRALDIDFKATMNQLLSAAPETTGEMLQSDPRHFKSTEVSLEAPQSDKRIVFSASDEAVIGNDSNSVNLEAEAAKLQENALMYSTTTQLLAKKLKGLSGIIESTSRY